MENVSKFANGFNFAGNVVKSGSKVSGFANPTMTVDTTKDKFTLDSKALSLLGLTTGDRVVLIDACFNDDGSVNNDVKNGRFFITRGFTDKAGIIQGAIIGKNKSFSYGVIWGAMQNFEAGINQIRPIELSKKNIIINQDGAWIALQKGICEVQPMTDEDGNPVTYEFEEGNPQPVFALRNIEFVDHTPRQVNKGEAGAEEGVDTNDIEA